eukprot:CAMPEP_0170510288 /NCGR_PEP_ID=MMETSP0208-20121228/65686_1 /TAXON_ID=197538 /ORGANISM="Strombidium inclinatum, Strain S3" /LENGTH=153 /DNA_ID=CAMNT_0010793739 /DNA_START=592 /DNA_END=1053 /DNA_ORIENTATION=-
MFLGNGVSSAHRHRRKFVILVVALNHPASQVESEGVAPDPVAKYVSVVLERPDCKLVFANHHGFPTVQPKVRDIAHDYERGLDAERKDDHLLALHRGSYRLLQIISNLVFEAGSLHVGKESFLIDPDFEHVIPFDAFQEVPLLFENGPALDHP